MVKNCVIISRPLLRRVLLHSISFRFQAKIGSNASCTRPDTIDRSPGVGVTRTTEGSLLPPGTTVKNIEYLSLSYSSILHPLLKLTCHSLRVRSPQFRLRQSLKGHPILPSTLLLIVLTVNIQNKSSAIHPPRTVPVSTTHRRYTI